jgi:eukaryotic-like serine/threonine-protein kinase
MRACARGFAMDDLLGQSLGPYMVIDQIGAGAMATVYKGYHPTMDRYVAIKVLPERLARDATFKARFLREARTIARLEHRYILPIYDFGEDHGVHYLVMRYVKGGTLGNLIDAGTLSLERAVRLVSQLGEALAYAHQHGVIHRDIKPANILIGQDGNVFLSDFGIAKVVEETLQLTGEGQAIGTPAYMAPEQVQGHGSDARTDIYALGILLYQAVTGEIPFIAETAFSLALMHVHAPPRPPRQLNPAIPEPLEQIILRAIAKNPADRFQQADEMVVALGQVFAAPPAAHDTSPSVQTPEQVSQSPLDPTLEAIAPPGEQLSPASTVLAAPPPAAALPAPIPSSTRRNTAILLSFLVIVIVTAIGYMVLNRNTAASSISTATESASSPMALAPAAIATTNALATTAPTPVAPVTPTPKPPIITLLHTLREGTEWLPGVAFSPDGQTLAVGSFGKVVQLWRVQDRMLLRTLKGHADWVWSVAFSPDGQFVASASEDSTVKLWRISDGTLVHTFTGHAGTVGSVAFAPDGAIVASAAQDQTIKLWRVSDGSLLRTLAGHTGFVRGVAFSPDGQTIASGSDDRSVRLWRIADGTQLRALEGHTDAVYTIAFSSDGQVLCSGSVDTTVKLWHVSDGMLLRTLEGHENTVNSVVFAPNMEFVVSASYDQTIKFWRVSDGAPIQSLGQHKGVVYSVAFSPNGQLLASASQDQTVNLWRVEL